MRETLPTLGLLSVVDGRLMSDIGDVYKVVSHFIGRPAYTHELGMYCGRARTMILAEFPAIGRRFGEQWTDARDAVLQEFGPSVEVPSEWNGSLADGKNAIETASEVFRDE